MGQKLNSHRRDLTPEEVRFARKILRRRNREMPFVIGCFGLVALYFVGSPVAAILVFISYLFLGESPIVEWFAISLGVIAVLLLVLVVYLLAETRSTISGSKARVFEVRALGFVSFEEVKDEGAYYAFELAYGRIVFVTGEVFDKAENFPCLDFAQIDIRDSGGKFIGSLVECRSAKAKPVRTIPAKITRTLELPRHREVRSGKLESLESDLKRPASEVVEEYSYKPGEGMLRKADPQQWQKLLLRKKVNGRAAFLWSKLAKPNVRLLPGPEVIEDKTPPLTSKLGGLPDLPKGTAWPTYQFVPWQPPVRPPGFIGRLLGRKPEPQPPPPPPEATPLPFLAQINLADIARVGCDLPLPETGLLLFFYEAHEDGMANSETTGFRVLFVPGGTETERPSSAPVPPAPVRSLECQAGETLPELEYMEEYVPAYSPDHFAEVYEALDEDIDTFIYSGNAFGGWAHSIQGTMELQCELFANGMKGLPDDYKEAEARGLNKNATGWRLLMQLDSEDTPELDWGDSGKVYFFCRKDDIAACRFERCCVIPQSH